MKKPQPVQILPESLPTSLEPLINSMEPKPNAKAEEHLIESDLVKKRDRRMSQEILFGPQ